MVRILVMLVVLMLPSFVFASLGTTFFSSIVAFDESDESDDFAEEKKTDDFAEEKKSDDFDEEKKSDDFDEEKKSDDFGEEKKPDDFGEEQQSDDFGEEKKSDDFAEEKKPDDFGEEQQSGDFAPPPVDDFVMEKRSDEVTSYVKPDVVKLSRPSYIYLEPSLTSKKMFELYKNDEMEIFEENGDFYRARFLGKEGWVLQKDVVVNKWHSYRLFLDLTGGVAWGGGDLENYSIIGNYTFAFHVSALDFLSVGAVFKSFSLDTDALYLGGGLQLRYLIHGLRTKNSRFALTFGGGYISTQEKPGGSMNNSINIVMQGYYIEGAVDYIYRVWEWIHLGVGGDITYSSLWGDTETERINPSFVQGGIHLKVIINLYR